MAPPWIRHCATIILKVKKKHQKYIYTDTAPGYTSFPGHTSSLLPRFFKISLCWSYAHALDDVLATESYAHAVGTSTCALSCSFTGLCVCVEHAVCVCVCVCVCGVHAVFVWGCVHACGVCCGCV